MKRIFVLAGILLCLAVAAPAASEVGVTDDTISLGTFQDLSGPGAYLGKICTTALNVWIDNINRQGGIHGRKLELAVEDNKYDPELTKVAFTKLVDRHKVFAI